MGIIKSSAALGALLCEGIGDTVRVSLTADPVREVYAARDLLAALGLDHGRVQFISCPTCGRCRVDLFRIAEEAEQALAAVTETITEALVKGEKVSIVGFGAFEVRDRAAKDSINPATKKPIHVPAKKVPAFKAGKALKEAVDK